MTNDRAQVATLMELMDRLALARQLRHAAIVCGQAAVDAGEPTWMADLFSRAADALVATCKENAEASVSEAGAPCDGCGAATFHEDARVTTDGVRLCPECFAEVPKS